MGKISKMLILPEKWFSRNCPFCPKLSSAKNSYFAENVDFGKNVV